MRNVAFSQARATRRGFTLIEVLIAIVIVAVLASVALPSFLGSIRKSRRAEAFTALNAVQQAQERWRANSANYAGNSELTPLPTDTPPGLGLASTTPSGYYTIAIANESGTSYDVIATAVSGTSQANDTNCAKLAVRSVGGNISYAGTTSSGTPSYAANSPCWSR